MDSVERESLASVLNNGPLSLEPTVAYALEIVGALSAAHASGIVHRDLKPANIMITASGIKVLDFGLAKRAGPVNSSEAATVTRDGETQQGQLLGTVAYMSPEQADGKQIDARSDIFSLGVVLYEMVCGQRPFRGESTLSTLASILREQPQSARELRPGIPASLERIILRCFAKKPGDRYQSAAEIHGDLGKVQTASSGVTWRKALVPALVLVLLASAAVLGRQWYVRSSRATWAEREALPQAAQLRERGQQLAALRLLTEAEQYVPASPDLIRLKDDLHRIPLTFETTPPGADVYALDYSDPAASDLSHWQYPGHTPLKTSQLPVPSFYRLRFTKDGFETVETSAAFTASLPLYRTQLHTKDETPAGMVWISPAPPTSALTNIDLPPVVTSPAWIDRYEVTNRQFKQFVDADVRYGGKREGVDCQRDR
jgi:hypothetical protein